MSNPGAVASLTRSGPDTHGLMRNDRRQRLLGGLLTVMVVGGTLLIPTPGHAQTAAPPPRSSCRKTSPDTARWSPPCRAQMPRPPRCC